MGIVGIGITSHYNEGHFAFGYHEDEQEINFSLTKLTMTE